MCDLMVPKGMTEERWQKEREVYEVEKPKGISASTAESVAALREALLAKLELKNIPEDKILP